MFPLEDQNGNTINYSVKKSKVSGYDTVQNGFDLTNQLRNGDLVVNKIQIGGYERDFTFRVILTSNGIDLPYVGEYKVLIQDNSL